MGKAFFHAHTYSANPIACAVALAGIELLTSQSIQDNIQEIIVAHQQFDKQIISHPKVKSTRQLGVIYALELDITMDRYGKKRYEIFDHFMKEGVFLRPLGNTVYILPPYTIRKQELNKVYKTISALLDQVL